MASATEQLPALTVTKKLFKLGDKDELPNLRSVIEPFTSGNFWVTSLDHEVHLTKIQKQFDSSKGYASYWGILHDLIVNGGSDEHELMEQLLSMGLNPDTSDRFQGHPAHACGFAGRPKCAFAVGLCRPNLKARNFNGHTPRKAAELGYRDTPDKPERVVAGERPKVADIWKRFEEDGFPSIAKLAHKKYWFAVQNLCRRRIITSEESNEKHEGKNVLEWAVHYRDKKMAEELRYLLKNLLIEDVASIENAPSAPILDEDVQQGNVQTAVRMKINSVAENLAAFASRIDDELVALKEKINKATETFQGNASKFTKREEKLEQKLKQFEALWLEKLSAFETSTQNVDQMAVKLRGDVDDLSCTVARMASDPTEFMDPMEKVLDVLLKKLTVTARAGKMADVLMDLIELMKKYDS